MNALNLPICVSLHQTMADKTPRVFMISYGFHNISSETKVQIHASMKEGYQNVG